jgi:hypothetical protein
MQLNGEVLLVIKKLFLFLDIGFDANFETIYYPCNNSLKYNN